MAAPLLAECPVNLECRVVQVLPGEPRSVPGEVVSVHYAEQYVADQRFDPYAADALVYGFGRYYRLGEVLGRHGSG